LIANGRLNGGDFTFQDTIQGSSTVDYNLLNIQDCQYVHEFTVLEQNEFSDNSPLNLCIGKQRALSLDIWPVPIISSVIGYLCV